MENNELNNITTTEETAPKNKKKTVIIIISVILAILIALGSVAAVLFVMQKNKLKDTSSEDDSSYVEIIYETITEEESGKQSVSSSDKNSSKNNSSNVSSTEQSTSGEGVASKDNSETTTGSGGGNAVSNKNITAEPEITLLAQIADNIYAIGGICSDDTEYVEITGNNLTSQKINTFAGGANRYFIGQLEFSGSTQISVVASAKAKEKSNAVKKSLVDLPSMNGKNLSHESEYRPVFGKNSRMHFYSAILNYTLSSSKLDSDKITQANKNISNIVSKSKNIGAETIFFIIPASTHIYPETIPDKYNKTSGANIYEEFKKIAANCGATVIYPLETMKAHKNDGEGYQLYQYTDSHWSAYGAYWGTYDLFNYISAKFPNAKPRTVAEMGFKTVSMYGGDALYNFSGVDGFETNRASGLSLKTRIKELTNIHTLSTSPTSTISSIYNSTSGLYLNRKVDEADIISNNKTAGLPKAIIMRDSFSRVAYDIINDRFSTVEWGKDSMYGFPENSTSADYVIYFFSERNLLKIMLNDSNATILGLQ